MTKDHPSPRWLDTLRTLMAAKKLNPRSLSLRAGLGATAVRDILEGRARFPRYDTVEALAAALEVTPAQLMGSHAAPFAKDDPLADDDLNLLTEIIARLQEAVDERKQQIGPRDFAAMAASLYRQVKSGERPRKSPKSALSRHIDQLVSYETLRRKQSSK